MTKKLRFDHILRQDNKASADVSFCLEQVHEVMEGYKDRLNFGADPEDILNEVYHAMNGRLDLLRVKYD